MLVMLSRVCLTPFPVMHCSQTCQIVLTFLFSCSFPYVTLPIATCAPQILANPRHEY